VSSPDHASFDARPRIEVYLDDVVEPAQVITEAPFHVELDTTALPNGDHVMRVVRVDASGRTSEHVVPFVVHNETEQVVTGLEPGATVSGRVGVDFTPPAPPPRPKRVGVSPWWYFLAGLVIFGGVYLFFVLVPTYNLYAPGSGKAGATAEAPAVPVDSALLASGEKVYGDNCAACHQASGEGMPPAIPALAGNDALAQVDTVLNTVAKGAGTMPAFASLDAQQLAGVATYVRNSWGNAFGGVTVDDAGKVAAASAPAAQPAQPEAAQPAQPEAAQPAQPSQPTQPAQPSAPQAATPAQPAQPTQPAQPSAPQAATPAQPAQPEATQPDTGAAQPSAPQSGEAGQPAAGSGAASAAGGQDFVTSSATLEAKDGTELGTVTLGTPVTVDASTGGTASVTVEGWSMLGAESVVFAQMGERIILATLNDAGQKARTVIEKKKDDYGSEWSHVSVVGTVSNNVLAGNLDTLWTKAQDLYASTCSACHALHPADAYTANQWPGTLKNMVPKTALDPTQVDLITKYLQYHAKGM